MVVYIQSLGTELGHCESWWVIVFIESCIPVIAVEEICPELRVLAASEICKWRIASLQR